MWDLLLGYAVVGVLISGAIGAKVVVNAIAEDDMDDFNIFAFLTAFILHAALWPYTVWTLIDAVFPTEAE